MGGARQGRTRIFAGVSRPGSLQGILIEATRRDLVPLVALDRECFDRLAWPAHGWWQVLVQPGWRVRVVRDSATLLAASVLRFDRPVMVLASLAVHPSCRRRGLGRLLLRDALVHASLEGARWLSLEVDRDNLGAIRLYRTNGFGTVRRFVEDGRPRFEMLHRVG